MERAPTVATRATPFRPIPSVCMVAWVPCLVVYWRVVDWAVVLSPFSLSTVDVTCGQTRRMFAKPQHGGPARDRPRGTILRPEARSGPPCACRHWCGAARASRWPPQHRGVRPACRQHGCGREGRQPGLACRFQAVEAISEPETVLSRIQEEGQGTKIAAIAVEVGVLVHLGAVHGGPLLDSEVTAQRRASRAIVPRVGAGVVMESLGMGSSPAFVVISQPPGHPAPSCTAHRMSTLPSAIRCSVTGCASPHHRQRACVASAGGVVTTWSSDTSDPSDSPDTTDPLTTGSA